MSRPCPTGCQHDSLYDPPCPICGGTGVDDRPDPTLELDDLGFDWRTCQTCRLPIGVLDLIERDDEVFHEECLANCELCGEWMFPDEATDDPTREPYRLLTKSTKAHAECCQEAAWMAETTRRSDERDYEHGVGGAR